MRLFISLSLPEDAIQALEGVQSSLPFGRLTPSENLHLTLAFLGDVDDAAAEDVHAALETLHTDPIALTLGGAEVFGGRHGQAIGLGAEGGAALRTLHDRIRSRLHGAGVAADRRRFRPHVTLARIPGRRNAAPLLAHIASVRLGPFTCSQFALVRSRLHPEGAIHDPLVVYPLG